MSPRKGMKTTGVVKKTSGVISSNGTTLEKLYCRKCCKFKKPTEFFSAVDLFLDSSGRMSVCKQCINEMFQNVYNSEMNLDKTLYKLCRILNVKYDDIALSATIEHFNKKSENGEPIDNVFGIYKTKLVTTSRTKVDDPNNSGDMTFFEIVPVFISDEDKIDDHHVDAEYLKRTWGTKFSVDDYNYLENELSEWKRTHKSDTKAEESLLILLCHKSLQIRKMRELEKPTASLEKEYQELMKTANVDPAKTAIAGAGKAQDTFSAFIKTIEENEPADYYKDKNLFKDIDNIDWYFRKYVTRPLRNFITQSRNFSLDDNDDDDFIEDVDENDINKIIGDTE